MNFNNIGKCQCCGRVRVNHTPQEANECLKRQDREKNKRRNAYYLRLELAEQIIREQKKNYKNSVGKRDRQKSSNNSLDDRQDEKRHSRGKL